jgi:hypothetical protein
MLATVKRDILTDTNGVPLHGDTIDFVEKVIANDIQIPKTGTDGAGSIQGADVNIGNTKRIGSLWSELVDSLIYNIKGVGEVDLGYLGESASFAGSGALLLKRDTVSKLLLDAGVGGPSYIDIYSIVFGANSELVSRNVYPWQFSGDVYMDDSLTIDGPLTSDAISCSDVHDRVLGLSLADVYLNNVIANNNHRAGDGTDHSEVASLIDDVDVYNLVDADVVASSGTFTLLNGFIKWHISGKKIWVTWRVSGTQAGGATNSVSVDVVTNTSLPSSPWSTMIEQATSEANFTKRFKILALINGWAILSEDGTTLGNGVYTWGGSFFQQLP